MNKRLLIASNIVVAAICLVGSNIYYNSKANTLMEKTNEIVDDYYLSSSISASRYIMSMVKRIKTEDRKELNRLNCLALKGNISDIEEYLKAQEKVESKARQERLLLTEITSFIQSQELIKNCAFKNTPNKAVK